MELFIERDGGSGEGIAFLEGMTVFVPFSLAGERVRVTITKKNKRYAQARLEAVLSPAPERADPFCPHYYACGGCSMQHMTYEKALRVKRERVSQTLRRLGGVNAEAALLEPFGMEEPFRYRNKAVLPIQGGKIGFYRDNSREIVEITRCALLPDLMNRALQATREWLAREHAHGNVRSLLLRSNREGHCMAALSTAGDRFPGSASWVKHMRAEVPQCGNLLHGVNTPEDGEAIGSSFRTLFGADSLRERISGIDVHISPTSFQQVNPAQAQRLYAETVRFSGLTGNETVLDAYCGAGALTQLLARGAAKAIGVEWSAAAIADAKHSAERNGCSNVEFLHGACEDVLPELLEEKVHPDVIVLDPPRKGCDARVIQAVLGAAPKKIVFISCDPATLARDMAALCAGGAYVPSALRVTDMFPWTAHVETVVLMAKLGAA